MNFRRMLALLIVVLAFCYAGSGLHASVKPKNYSVVELTRTAKLIVVGRVATLLPNSIIVKVYRQFKGATNKSEVEVLWDYVGNIEQRPLEVTVGEQVLLFLVAGKSAHDPIGASQGLIKLEEVDVERYRFVIQKIIAFEPGTNSPVLRSKLLRELLVSRDGMAELAALEIIYLEFQNKTFSTASLIKPVTSLAKSNNTGVAINAIGVLTSIGDKSVIPEIIKLLKSPDVEVANRSGDALTTMTGDEIEFADLKTTAERTIAVTRWEEWWRRNKVNAVLTK